MALGGSKPYTLSSDLRGLECSLWMLLLRDLRCALVEMTDQLAVTRKPLQEGLGTLLIQPSALKTLMLLLPS